MALYRNQKKTNKLFRWLDTSFSFSTKGYHKLLISNFLEKSNVSTRQILLVLILGFFLIKNEKELRPALVFGEKVRGLKINAPANLYNLIQNKFMSQNLDCNRETIVLFNPQNYSENSVSLPVISMFALLPCNSKAVPQKLESGVSKESQIIRL
ncbi:hypothetical protein [Leptospira interrogans]|uniref:hypothetical protein n=1 Tax=Leptospira interrogans TaxID=173 RepID=UPI0003625CC8|nr:hypothetical protein [Leptospira interrogans]QCO35596.1 hypothetical protein E4414_21505 [Leptospira interrogans]UMQ52672.1 hypothetical protein FH582_01550 [Leptospira interrogans]